MTFAVRAPEKGRCRGTKLLLYCESHSVGLLLGRSYTAPLASEGQGTRLRHGVAVERAAAQRGLCVFIGVHRPASLSRHVCGLGFSFISIRPRRCGS